MYLQFRDWVDTLKWELWIAAPAPGEPVQGLTTVRAEVAPALAPRVARVSLRTPGKRAGWPR